MLNKPTKTMGMVLLLLAPALSLGGCSDANDPTAPPVPQDLETRLTNILDTSVGPNTPGVALRVLGNGIDLTLSAGVASLDTGEPLTAEHLYHTASSGKSFIGTAFARLVMDGRLNPDNALATWLPVELTSRIPQADQITARHLLQHTSGIIDVLNEMDEALLAIENDYTRVWTNAALVQFALDKPLNFAPGSAFSYSNTNYMLLALILENVTGKPHGQALRELVFDPLGMTSTFTSNQDQLIGKVSTGHMIAGGYHEDAMEVLLRWEAGSGGQWTTVDDLARFLHGLFETDLVLDDAGRAAMLAGSAYKPYGFGLAWQESSFGQMVWHHGVFLGSTSQMAYFPARELSVTMHVNGIVVGESYAEQLFAQVMVAVQERVGS